MQVEKCIYKLMLSHSEKTPSFHWNRADRSSVKMDKLTQ